MKIVSYVLALTFFLSGCGTVSYQKAKDQSSATTLQEKRDVLIKWMPSHNGQQQNFPKIRGELLRYNGEDSEFLRNLINECYNSGNDECAYDFYVKELNNKKDEFCSKNPDCAKDRETSQAINDLNRTYYLVMARNQYDQAEFDLTIRQLCKAAGVGQRRGIPLSQIEDDVNQQPGLSPEIRGQLRDVSVSCWVLSKNGVLDGTTEIKNIY
ncbi:hypothetical protein [Yersinia enterocolitica]|uniref:hypothetical protein n=1 Tax=Yersinia enterocolitica TaxID=630 RepID=UPI001C610E5B|nr:hypothetical protein [Yersinia enterocolitica]EKN4037568.1 hypothetical protein [Yersinia enterocolitica]MBW5854240.1 hypothetical protein [Yersinia enterocolitica]MBW5861684.1 hypothetical protein [Yersinia enterocolitica]MBW5871438.1 hypothetical protein [Yersinia enterocolitica]